MICVLIITILLVLTLWIKLRQGELYLEDGDAGLVAVSLCVCGLEVGMMDGFTHVVV